MSADSRAGADRLVCPSCARAYPPSERFCEECRMPLVYADPIGEMASATESADERQQRVRKIKPQYTEGELVKVARAADLGQAEFIAGLLLEEGIPSVLRGSIAGYTPMVDPRDVMVPASAAEAAREALNPAPPGASG